MQAGRAFPEFLPHPRWYTGVVNDNTDENAGKSDNMDLATRRRRFIRELVGIVLGASAAMMISSLIPAIREQYTLGIVLLWGGAIGGLLASYERFERAGAALTRREGRALNYAVGFGVPVLILFLMYWFLFR